MGREAERQLVHNERARVACAKAVRALKLRLLAALPMDNEQQIAACDVGRVRALVEELARLVDDVNELLRRRAELLGEAASE